MVEQVGSIDRLLAGARRAAESPLWLNRNALYCRCISHFSCRGFVYRCYGLGVESPRGAGVINYTPGRYAVSVVVFASIILFAMVSKGKVDMAEFTPYFGIFAMSTIFPIMILFDNPRR